MREVETGGDSSPTADSKQKSKRSHRRTKSSGLEDPGGGKKKVFLVGTLFPSLTTLTAHFVQLGRR